jgi:small-conductance mechanosensitive channel
MHSLYILLGIILWVIIALWPAMIAKRKGYSFIGFFALSLFFWWITLFVALFMKDKSTPTPPTASPQA